MRSADHSVNCMKENVRRASKKSITPMKPGENKGGKESYGGYKNKTLIHLISR